VDCDGDLDLRDPRTSRVTPAFPSYGIFRLLRGHFRADVRERGGYLRKVGGIGILVVVLVLGYGLYTGAIGPEQLFGELLGQGAGSGGSGRVPSGPSAAPGAPSPSEAGAMLREIAVAPAGSMAGYSREEFPLWAEDGTEFGWDEPDGSCDVRDDALVRDGRGVEVDEDCSITAGKWLDPYTGATLEDSEDVDIDHIVPLANAWRSGASAWDENRRETYANDPGVLLSVDDAANQTKGDKSPEAWLPPNADYRCEYARRWISIKHHWNLTVTSQEKATLQELLQGCKAR
jgi:hypothetical protein